MELIVMGDFNYDFFNTSSYSKQDLVKSLGSLNLTQMVNAVTRSLSGTCLDHIYVSHPGRMHSVSTINVGLSDHLPVFVLRRFKQPQVQNQSSRKKQLAFEYRNLKRIDKDMFIKYLNEAPAGITCCTDYSLVFEKSIQLKQY